MKNIRKFWPVITLLFMALILTSCAPGNERFIETQANFWGGLWHGFISLFSFIISLFNDQVNVYEANNTGWPYNLGFILGCMMFYGGSSKSTCKRKGS